MRQRYLVLALVAFALGVGYFYGQKKTAGAAGASASVPSAIPVPPGATPPATDEPRDAPSRKTAAPARVAPGVRPPLPPAGAPLVSTFDELRARADSGDAEAASRLLRDLQRCHMTQRFERYLPAMVSFQLGEGRKADTAEDLAQQERALDQTQRMLDLVKKNSALCAGVEASQLEAIIPVMLDAAQLGDRRAADCYVGMDFTSMPGLLEHPEWLAQYKQNAMALAQSAYQQGDWVVVGLLQHAYAGVFESSLLGQLLGADPVQAYRYLRLQRLGASGDFVAKLDGQLAEAEKTLSKDQIAEADAWAHDAYGKYFHESTSNELSNGVNVCSGMDEL